MSDSRPLPEYGEYATPEEQARAMGRHYVPPTEDAAPAEPAPVATPTSAAGFYAALANRFVTVLLLAVGGFTLLTEAPGYLDVRPALAAVAKYLGKSGVTVPASVDAAGIWLLVANLVIYGLTVLLSLLALRAGRRSAYIPVLGFLVFGLASDIIIAVFAPGFFSQLTS